MAVEWKKILLEGDAAELTSDAPSDVGTTAAVGNATTAARANHVHDTAAGFIDNADKFTAGVVDTTALGADAVDGTKIADDAVGSEHIEALSAALDFAGNQAQDMVLHTVADADARNALTPIKGKMVWQTDQSHPFICVSQV